MMGDELNMTSALIPNDELGEEQIRRARLAIASNAYDAEDCRLLLDMLGLLDSRKV